MNIPLIIVDLSEDTVEILKEKADEWGLSLDDLSRAALELYATHLAAQDGSEQSN